MRPWTFVPLLLLLPATAGAVSRLVVTLSEPATIFLDGMAQASGMSGQRVVVNQVEPGTRRLDIRTPEGKVLYSGVLDVPDGVEVTAAYGAENGFVVTSPVGQAAAAGPDGEPRPAADDPAASTFDENEGSYASGQKDADPYAGNPEAFGKTVSTGATVARKAGVATGIVSPTAGVAMVAVPAVARSAASTVKNAEAGGLDALRGRSGSTFKQGRPTPPAAVVGYVEFVSLDGEPALVFLEGFLIAEFPRGEPGAKKKVKLEIGRHEIEIWDGETAIPRYKGVLQIDEGFTVNVAFSEARAPEATNRSWAWYNR